MDILAEGKVVPVPGNVNVSVPQALGHHRGGDLLEFADKECDDGYRARIRAASLELRVERLTDVSFEA
jgi:hypothetical protein